MVDGAFLAPGARLSTLAGALALALLGLALLYFADCFARRAFSTVAEFTRTLAGAGAVGAGTALLLAWRWPSAFQPLSAAELLVGFALVGAVLARSTVMPRLDRGPVRALVVSSSEDSILEENLDELAARAQVVGRVRSPLEQGQCAQALAFHRPEVVLVEAPITEVDFELLHLCSVRRIRVLALLSPSYGPALRGPIVSLGGLPWLLLRPLPLARRHVRGKRALDVSLTLLVAPLVLPVLAATAIAIAATSRGGVLYRQVRLGEGGRPFVLLKFRTMHADAERDSGPVLARPDDPRATPLGRVLRRLHLDELPQLWNVLRGEMSLVGPRPERPELVETFGAIPEYDLRHLLRPGLTGLAQLVGGYSSPASDKLRCDLLYISSRSLRLDFRLIAATTLALLRGSTVG